MAAKTRRKPPANGDVKDVKHSGKAIVSTPCHNGTPARLRAFWEAYAKTGLLLESCDVAGISYMTHYRKLESDPVYRHEFEEMEQRAAQRLEDRAYELAMEGDTHMLHILLKRFRPIAYRERISADVSGTINLTQRMEEANQRLIEMYPSDNAA